MKEPREEFWSNSRTAAAELMKQNRKEKKTWNWKIETDEFQTSAQPVKSFSLSGPVGYRLFIGGGAAQRPIRVLLLRSPELDLLERVTDFRSTSTSSGKNEEGEEKQAGPQVTAQRAESLEALFQPTVLIPDLLHRSSASCDVTTPRGSSASSLSSSLEGLYSLLKMVSEMEKMFFL